MLRAEPLAQRMLRDQRLELADDVAVMPERQVGLDPPLERGEAQLLEARALVPCERLRELGQRGPAPERERVAQQLARLLGHRPCASACASVGDRALEAGEVELVVADLEQVAGSTRVEPRLRQRLAQLRDVDLHHLLRRVRHVLAPEGVDDAARGRRCGSRSGAGPPAAPAACPPRSAAARGRRRPPAGRGAESPSREAADATTVAASRPVRARASVRWCNSEGSAGALAAATDSLSIAAAPRKKRPIVAPRAP